MLIEVTYVRLGLCNRRCQRINADERRWKWNFLYCYSSKTIIMTDYIREHYVLPLYLKLLNGNFLWIAKDVDPLVNSTRMALYEVTDKELIQMYDYGWREAMTASWLCGIRRFSQHLQKIESLLIPSETSYAGQFHCFALARFDDAESVRVLLSHLDTYLPLVLESTTKNGLLEPYGG